MIERYRVEVYNDTTHEWQELLGSGFTDTDYSSARSLALTLVSGGGKARVLADKYELADTELVEEFRNEYGPEEDD